MTVALLPPDPSKDGWYWVRRKGGGIPAPFRFFHDQQLWWNYDNHWQRKASDMLAWGWELASPHPLPEPEQLDALHALKEELVRIGAEMADSMSARTVLHGIVERLGQRLSVVIEGKP